MNLIRLKSVLTTVFLQRRLVKSGSSLRQYANVANGIKIYQNNGTLEETNIYKEQMKILIEDKHRNQLTFPSTLQKDQLQRLRIYGRSIGLRIKLEGRGSDRVLVCYKKHTVAENITTQLELPHSSIEPIAQLLENHPLNDSEKESTILRPPDCKSQAHLSLMFGESRSKIKMTIPPLVKGAEQFDSVRQNLPIFEHRDEILSAINQNQVIIISGQTGSGKTTQVPQYIMEECTNLGRECRIICTQPRRLAATSIATRISQERNDILGKSVGYQIRFDSRITPTTNLIFATSGFLLGSLIRSKQVDVYKNLTHIIIDEVHEREQISDFLLIAIRDAIKLNKHLKVILMSATLDSELLSSYFDDCPVINVPGRLYDVKTMHLGEVLMETGYKSKEMEIHMAEYQAPEIADVKTITEDKDVIEDHSKALQQCTEEAYQMTIRDEIDHRLLHHVINYIHLEKPIDGSILVFLPGYQDIMTQKELIERFFDVDNYQLFVLHSGANGTNSAEQASVFEPMPQGIRKIILSTNIAETSLTIKDVVYVIDAGKVKQLSYDSSSGSSCLASVRISQACAKQRAGRAGRTQSGFCYRLYSKEQHKSMEKHTLPEMMRIPLTEVCLNAKMLSADLSIEEFLLKALQPPAVKNIRQSIELLKQIDVLDENENITHLGMHLAHLPVDCQYGKMILYSIMMQCLDPVMTIVSILSIKDLFVLPFEDERHKIKLIKNKLAGNSKSDHEMLLNMYNAWTKQNEKEKFCEENFISSDNMKMTHDLRRLIMDYLKKAKLIDENNSTRNLKQLNVNSNSWNIVKACLTAGAYPNIGRITNGRFSLSQIRKCLPHSSSILRQSNFKHVDAGWLIYDEKSWIGDSPIGSMRNITIVSALDVLLFAGPINLPANSFTHLEQKPLVAVKIDDWISFILQEDQAQHLFQLRQKFAAMFSRFLKTSDTFQMTNEEERMMQILSELIKQNNVIEKQIEITK